MAEIRPYAGLPSMRLGSRFDGGYVLPMVVIENAKRLISYGYGNNYDFEKDFLKINSSNNCSLYDGSIDGKRLFARFVKYLAFQSPKTKSFPRYLLLDIIRYARVKLNRRITYYSKYVTPGPTNLPKAISALQTFETVSDESEFIVKIDVEGAEYEILKSVLDYLDSISCLIVEFHQVDEHTNSFLYLISQLKKDFFISNIHFNNYSGTPGPVPKTIEAVFVSKRYFTSLLYPSKEIPSKLDSPCKPSRPEISYTYED